MSSAVVLLAACCRLVQGKEKGATIEVDGEKVALGIPQVRFSWGVHALFAGSVLARRLLDGL